MRIELTRDSNQHRLFEAWLGCVPDRVAQEVEVDLSKGVSVVFDSYGPLVLLERWLDMPVNVARVGCDRKHARSIQSELRLAKTQADGIQAKWENRRQIGEWVLAGDEDEEECGQIVAPAHRNERCYRVRFREGKERVIPAILLEPASPLEILGAQDDDPKDHNPNLDF